MPAPRLIVNADDLGLQADRDDGILALHAAGAITSASLVVNGPGAAEAARRAVAAGLPLGLHLNLGEGAALTGPSPLTDADGRFPGKFETRCRLDAADRAAPATQAALSGAIADEIRAQVERFRALTGAWPTHVDGHHHIHVQPRVAALLAPLLAREYGIHRVRLPRADEDLAPAFAGDPATLAFHRAVQAGLPAAAASFAASGLRWPDRFLGLGLMGRRMQEGALRAALEAVAEAGSAIVELMCHPGLPAGGAGGDGFGHSPERRCEHDTLLAVFSRTRGTAPGGPDPHGERAPPPGAPGCRPWPAGFGPASFADLRRPPPGDGLRILIYGKLSPASGNRTTAERLAELLAVHGEVLFRPRPPEGIERADRLAAEAAALRRLAIEEGIDLAIGIHCGHAGRALAAAFSGDGPPLPCLLVASGTDLNEDAATPASRSALAAAMRGAAGVAALSPELAERAATLVAPSAVAVAELRQVPSVASASTYSLRAVLGLAAGQKIALLPAGIRPVKDIAFAIEAGAQALLDQPDAVLAVVGPVLDADYHAHCASLLREWTLRHRALKGRLRLLPALPRDDYLTALREAALLVNTSRSEGLSNAVLEAMAAGVPVLARDIPGNRAALGEPADADTGGLYFTGLPEFVVQFGRLAADPALAARLGAAGRRRFAALHDEAGERRTLDGLVAAATRRLPAIALPSGAVVRLGLAPGTHPASDENRALFAAAPLPARPGALRVLDLGCGCGVLGWSVADRLAAAGRRLAAVDFADIDATSVAGLAHAFRRAAPYWTAHGVAPRTFVGDLFAALPAGEAPYDLILANLPQTPSEVPIAPDRWGGADGLALQRRFIADLPRHLAPGGEAWCSHIGLADPAGFAAAVAAAGLVAEVVAEQERCLAAADYEALAPGLADALARRAADGRAELAIVPGDGTAARRLRFPARLIRLRHA